MSFFEQFFALIQSKKARDKAERDGEIERARELLSTECPEGIKDFPLCNYAWGFIFHYHQSLNFRDAVWTCYVKQTEKNRDEDTDRRYARIGQLRGASIQIPAQPPPGCTTESKKPSGPRLSRGLPPRKPGSPQPNPAVDQPTTTSSVVPPNPEPEVPGSGTNPPSANPPAVAAASSGTPVEASPSAPEPTVPRVDKPPEDPTPVEPLETTVSREEAGRTKTIIFDRPSKSPFHKRPGFGQFMTGIVLTVLSAIPLGLCIQTELCGTTPLESADLWAASSIGFSGGLSIGLTVAGGTHDAPYVWVPGFLGTLGSVGAGLGVGLTNRFPMLDTRFWGIAAPGFGLALGVTMFFSGLADIGKSYRR